MWEHSSFLVRKEAKNFNFRGVLDKIPVVLPEVQQHFTAINPSGQTLIEII